MSLFTRKRENRAFRASFEEMEPRKLLNAAYVVTNEAGYNTPGSLRWAVAQSNATPSTPSAPNVINFSAAMRGMKIVNAIGPINITSSVTIAGTGQLIDGAGVSQLFVTTGANTLVNFCNLNMNHGRADGNAALGNLRMGGAILGCGGTVALYNDSFSDDIAADAGGAVYAYTGGIQCSGSVFAWNKAANYGGALGAGANLPVYLVGAQSSFYQNTAGLAGGAISAKNGWYGVFTTNPVFSGNKPSDVFLY